MKYERYFIIRADDIKDSVKEKWVESIHNGLIEDGGVELHERMQEVCSADPFDLGRIIPDDAGLYIEKNIKGAIDKAWCEIEIKVTL